MLQSAITAVVDVLGELRPRSAAGPPAATHAALHSTKHALDAALEHGSQAVEVLSLARTCPAPQVGPCWGFPLHELAVGCS